MLKDINLNDLKNLSTTQMAAYAGAARVILADTFNVFLPGLSVAHRRRRIGRVIESGWSNTRVLFGYDPYSAQWVETAGLSPTLLPDQRMANLDATSLFHLIEGLSRRAYEKEIILTGQAVIVEGLSGVVTNTSGRHVYGVFANNFKSSYSFSNIKPVWESLGEDFKKF